MLFQNPTSKDFLIVSLSNSFNLIFKKPGTCNIPFPYWYSNFSLKNFIILLKNIEESILNYDQRVKKK